MLPCAASEEGPGDRLDQSDLAAVLRRIADEVPDAFHRGPVADTVGYEALNILERFAPAPGGPASAEHLHLLAEACGHAFVDSVTYYGDPEHVRTPPASHVSDGLTSHLARVV